MIKKRQNQFSAYRIFVILIIAFFCISLISQFNSRKGSLAICWSKESPAFINAQAISSFGKYVAIGTNLGLLSVYNNSGDKVLEKLFKDPILDIKFSYDESYVYVRCYSVYAVNIIGNSVSWEKFLKNHYVSDFFPFRDGKLGFIFMSKTELSNLYIYTDTKGRNIREFKLPEEYGRFNLIASSNGKYTLFSTEGGDIYNIRYDGYVNWNTHLDPPVAETSDYNYPILADINNDGLTCIYYTFEQFGKRGQILNFIDLNGKSLWQKNLSFKVNNLTFSPDGNKISITYSSYVQIFRTDGSTLIESYQYGYEPTFAILFPTKLLVGYKLREDLNSNIASEKSIIQFRTIYNEKSLFQARFNSKSNDFLISRDGNFLFVVSKPFFMSLYRYK